MSFHLGTLAETQPDTPAVICASSGAMRSFRALDERSNQLARLLRSQGLRRGDHVALYLENDLCFFDVIWTCIRSGLYVTPINHHLPASSAAYIVDDCDAKALVAGARLDQSAELGGLCSRCTVKLSVGGSVPGYQVFDSAIAGHPAERLTDESVGTFMLYSSGTTGRPKGVKRPLPETTPENGHPAMKSTAAMFGMDSATIYLSPAPLYHSAPVGYTSAVIQAGGTVVMMQKFDAETALALIEKYRVTHSMWVPTMFVRMLKLGSEARSRHDLSSHRCAIHAAAPCPVEVKRQMIAWWGPILEEFYSSTESAGFARISSKEWLERPGSVGRSSGRPFHICDEQGREQPPGEPGLVYSELPQGTRFSYYKDADKTAAASHPDHADWVTVGDIGYLDADGYLYLTDRQAFMIISGGVNIYPRQIEDVLTLHPKVADVAVIGVPNEELGEEVKAVVEPAPGVEPSEALAKEIQAFVREALGRQLTPRSVDFTDAIPRLPTGKLFKKALRDKYWPAPPSPS
jgi:fatty-acyl-CoA synthase